MTALNYPILLYGCQDECRKNIDKALTGYSSLKYLDTTRDIRLEILKKHYDAIIMNDVNHDTSVLKLLRQIHIKVPFTPIILLSETEKVEFIVEAVKLGAYDFVVAPFSPQKIQLVVKRAIKERESQNEIDYLRRTQDIVYEFKNIVAESPSIKKVISSLKKFSETDSTILITGDTGTGKSFLSGTIHFNSHRRAKPFIKINCANIPETLLESELFGHEKGAFTGADKQRTGRFEQANGGTIFLDEIGEICMEIQSKLLRVLEEKSFERVGGNKTITVDVRVIAATNKDLEKQISLNKFREDLFYRINVLPVHLPSLQERPQCIEELSKVLLKKSCIQLRKKSEGFSKEAMDIIKGYNWPGNIRQLSNTIERALILEENGIIGPESISIPNFQIPGIFADSYEPLELHEKELVLKALKDNLWVQKNAARRLGISPRALNYKIKKFGITHPNWRKNR
ncbi:MAG: sigma-54 dependent transcriptional regulator [Desulfobulbaceae bacterium]|nr:sigma-54 dependent transcriptional regulator [Desulfobulbaceae bacterium]